MNRDKAQSESTFMRWIDAFRDGMYAFTRKGKSKIPNHGLKGKRFDRKWRRNRDKKEIEFYLMGGE